MVPHPPLPSAAVPAMTPAEGERYVAAAAAALGLRLSPDVRPGVIAAFERAAALASLLDTIDLAPHHEGASSFVPVEPDTST